MTHSVPATNGRANVVGVLLCLITVIALRGSAAAAPVDNTAYGTNALLGNTGSYCSAFGFDAIGCGNSAACNSGDGNTATGAGASARISIGIAVFYGMISSTCLVVVFVPSFYVVMQRFEERRKRPVAKAEPAPAE